MNIRTRNETAAAKQARRLLVLGVIYVVAMGLIFAASALVEIFAPPSGMDRFAVLVLPGLLIVTIRSLLVIGPVAPEVAIKYSSGK